MTKIIWDEGFKRSYRRKVKANKRLKKKFWIAMEIFEKNPFASQIRTHKLSGKLKGLWAFSVDYNCRIIFKFVEGKSKILLIDIGGHNEVY